MPSKNISAATLATGDGAAIGAQAGKLRYWETAPWTRGRRRPPLTLSSTTIVLDPDHEGRLLYCVNSAATTFTIPTDSAEAFPVGGSVSIVRGGTGQITIATPSGGGGLTLLSGAKPKFRVTGSRALLERISPTIWVLSGDMIA